MGPAGQSVLGQSSSHRGLSAAAARRGGRGRAAGPLRAGSPRPGGPCRIAGAPGRAAGGGPAGGGCAPRPGQYSLARGLEVRRARLPLLPPRPRPRPGCPGPGRQRPGLAGAFARPCRRGRAGRRAGIGPAGLRRRRVRRCAALDRPAPGCGVRPGSSAAGRPGLAGAAGHAQSSVPRAAPLAGAGARPRPLPCATPAPGRLARGACRRHCG
ncbi:hypothetical protein D9M70_509060 [compost metagenome]